MVVRHGVQDSPFPLYELADVINSIFDRITDDIDHRLSKKKITQFKERIESLRTRIIEKPSIS